MATQSLELKFHAIPSILMMNVLPIPLAGEGRKGGINANVVIQREANNGRGKRTKRAKLNSRSRHLLKMAEKKVQQPLKKQTFRQHPK